MRTSLTSFDESGRYNVAAKCKYIYDSDVKTKVWLEDNDGNAIPVQAQYASRWKEGEHYCIYGLEINLDDGKFVGNIDTQTTVTDPPETQLAIVGSLSGDPLDRWNNPLPMAQTIQTHFEDMTSHASTEVSQAVVHTGTLCGDSDLLQQVFASLTKRGIEIYHVPADSETSSNDLNIDGVKILIEDTITHGDLKITGWAPHTGARCPVPDTDPDVFVIGNTPFSAQYSSTVKETVEDLPCTPNIIVFQGQGPSHVRHGIDTTALFTSDLNRWHPESITGWYVTSQDKNQFYRNITPVETPHYERIQVNELRDPNSAGANRLRNAVDHDDVAVIESKHSIHPDDFNKQIQELAGTGENIRFRNRWQLVPQALFSGPIWSHSDCELKTSKPNEIDQAMKSEYHHYFALLDDPPLKVYTPVPVFSLYRYEQENKKIKNRIKSANNIIDNMSLSEQLDDETIEMVREFYDLVYRRFVTGLIQYDVITVYPSSTGGYNPLLRAVAQQIAEQSSIDYYPLIERQMTNTPQKNLDTKEERYNNTAGELSLTDTALPYIADQNILVIDDVVTSGASMVLAARKLMSAGGKNVAGASFTMTDSYKNRQRIKSAWLDVTNAARSVKALEH